MMKNPFQYGGIVKGPHFADRTKEIQELTREMENNNRVFLVSPRRFGKTCLLHNLMITLTKHGMACVYIDLNALPDLKSFAGAMTSLTAKALESNSDRLLKIFSSFHKLRPKLSVDQDGSFSGSLELVSDERDALSALVEGLAHAQALCEKKNKKLVTIIDEFSDIDKYNGGSVEKALRSEIQKQANIAYIFSGSEESVMLAMVQDKKRAFYKLGRIMRLGSIERENYTRFIMGWLNKGTYKISVQDITRILDIGDDVPYNIQRLCHTLWESAIESKTVDSALIDSLPVTIARQDSAHYELIWQSTSQIQKALLIALTDDPEALLFSKDFQLRHGIGPSSTIKASLTSLLKKSILHKSLDGRYRFVDLFMPCWIRSIRRFG